MRTKTDLFGKLLLEKGLISKDQLDIALAEQKNTGEFLGITLSNITARRPYRSHLINLLNFYLIVVYCI